MTASFFRTLLLGCCILLAGSVGRAFAQNATLTGTVTDSASGEALIGATVLVEGTQRGANTDFEGRFRISQLAPGTYTLRISYLEYQTRVLKDLTLDDGETRSLTIRMKPAASATTETIEVVAAPDRGNMATVLTQQQNATTISDGLSAQFIRATPDRDLSQVIRRVSGVTVQEGGFAVVRGLADRYNTAVVNGLILPSTEPDRKAFSFGLFPSNMIDNLFIVKTAAPNLPGEFAGAVVNVQTMDVPAEDFLQLRVKSGYHSLTTFDDFTSMEGGDYDFLGVDDGTRALPEDFPGTSEIAQATNSQRVAFAREYGRSWGTEEFQAMPDLSLGLSGGKNFSLGKRKSLGVIGAVSYNQRFRRAPLLRSDYQVEGDGYVPLYQYDDQQFNRNVLGGSLLNLALRFNEYNSIALKNTATLRSQDQTILRTGENFIRNQLVRSQFQYFNSNLLTLNQLEGNHYLPKGKWRLRWNANYSTLTSETPDFRRLTYIKGAEDPDSVAFEVNVPEGSPQPGNAGTFYSTLNQWSYGGNFKAEKPFKLGNQQQRLEAGAMLTLTERRFDARNLGFRRFPEGVPFLGIPGFEDSLLFLPPEEIFLPRNMQDTTGYFIDDITNPSDFYEGNSELQGYYLLFDNQIGRRWRVVWGLRYEQFTQQLDSYTNNDLTRDSLVRFVDTTYHDFLPSVNLTYKLTEKMNLRVAASRTVARPSFREIAPFAFYDFSLNYVRTGNPELIRTEITNLDLRYEFYPGQNQIASVSVFYKFFDNPIEQNIFIGNDPPTADFVNATNGAENYGIELDFRKHFGFLKPVFGGRGWEFLYLFGNFAYIQSEIDVSNIPGEINDTRPLQGQSDYVLNGGLQYQNPLSGLSASLLVNRVGRRIWQVGQAPDQTDPNNPSPPYPNIWENPRTILDFKLGYTFFEHLNVSLTLRDLLAQDLVFYQDVDNSGNFNEQEDNIFLRQEMGQSVSLGLRYSF